MKRALVVGFGSIGRRHFRHFRNLGCSPMDVFRTGKATMPDDEELQPDNIYYDFDEALAQKPDVVVVANPTSLHVDAALKAVRAGCHVLVEKPISHNLDGCLDLAAEAVRHQCIVGIAHNQRYHPLIRRLKQMIETGDPLGTPLMAHAHMGGYLPDWHPWEDYKQGYAARQDLGGGSSLTNIHELDFILWLLGDAKVHAGVELGMHPLETDVDEASAFVLRHESGVISALTFSLAHKPQRRTTDISFTGGNAHLDLIAGELRLDFAANASEVIEPDDEWDMDDTYRDQAADFLAAVEGTTEGAFTKVDEAMAALTIALDRKGSA
ncbi:Gfo/Idh/MocA family oxidoreductase [bacterium]|nr:Gfo/Idh/MocA family oxidoreductase [bacterium]